MVRCTGCLVQPSHKAVPCGHPLCLEHYMATQEGETACESCGEIITSCTKVLKATPAVDTGKKNRASKDVLIAGLDKRFIPAVTSNTGNLENKNFNQAASGHGTGNRYLPPQRRGDPEMAHQDAGMTGGRGIFRPESSMSNASFMTQIPNHASSNYSYGPSQLTQNMASYKPFGNQNMQPSSSRPYMGQGITRPGFPGGARNNAQPQMQIQHQQAPSSSSSGKDSAAPGSRAAYLAQRIMNGEADDPNDIDYGNCGESRKVPPPPAPAPYPSANNKGKSTALTNAKAPGGHAATPNTDGNPAAFLGSKKVGLPDWYTGSNSIPSIEQAFESLPFIEPCRLAAPTSAGVVKVVNMPYHTSRSEINAFLGKNAQICSQPPGSPFHAIHVNMDRHSGKTMDAYVEVSTPAEAVWLANTFSRRAAQGRPGKLGDRPVEIVLSSQEELMRAMFPHAKNVTWEGGVPVVDYSKDMYYEGVPSAGFRGFLQDEEIVLMTKHAETPQRSPFAQRCMIRCYESLISTLYKYPWFAHEDVLIFERGKLFEATISTIKALIALLRRVNGGKQKADIHNPTISTLIELATAVFVCPGFTDKQKALLANTLHASGHGKLADDRSLNLRFGGIDKYGKDMPFHVLVKQPGVPHDLVDYFAAIMRDATIGSKPLTLADLHALRASSKDMSLFGEVDIDYSACKTLADAGRAELRFVEQILARKLARTGSMSSGTPSVPSLHHSGSGSGMGGGHGSQGYGSQGQGSQGHRSHGQGSDGHGSRGSRTSSVRS